MQNELPIVNTQLGAVRGHYKCSYENQIFAAFEGIPYAKPPIGKLRFEEPKSAEPWSGVFNATTTHECAQHTQAHLANANEDCLYINVYVPRKKPIINENLDVIVYIHGGAFVMGSPNMGGPEYLMHKDVIFVNLNYRLGVFGFLSTGNGIVSGNNGLKDQVLALKWIQSNIKYFGGNANSVTIVGVSAGAACVHFHYFSSLSKGLFQKGISHSGTALAPWAVYVNPLENTLKIAEAVKCNNSTVTDIVNCLKTKSAEALSNATYKLYAFFGFPFAPFAPVIEILSETAFLTTHPYELLKKGDFYDVPWISTVTSGEGLSILSAVPNIEVIINEWDKGLPYILNYYSNSNISDITNKITEYYFGGSPINDKGITKAASDRLFRIPMEMSVQMQVKVSKSPVYSYLYAYESDLQFPISSNTTYEGAYHGSDSALIYYTFMFANDKLSENDEGVKNFFVNAVSTFAQDGIPKSNNIVWEPVTDNDEWGYLHIYNKDHIVMDYDKDVKLMEFWNSLGCDYWNQKYKITIKN